jgi:hypothetical protein
MQKLTSFVSRRVRLRIVFVIFNSHKLQRNSKNEIIEYQKIAKRLRNSPVVHFQLRIPQKRGG